MASRAKPKDRSLPSRRPGPANRRQHEKAGFIEQNNVRALPCGFFLCASSPWPPSERCAPRSVPPLASRASGRKSPANPSVEQRNRRGSERHSDSRSPWRSADKSTDRWRTRWPWRLSRGASSVVLSDVRSVSTAARAQAWTPGLSPLSSGPPPTSASRSWDGHPPVWPPRPGDTPPPRGRSPDVSCVRVPLRFHAVSYITESAFTSRSPQPTNTTRSTSTARSRTWPADRDTRRWSISTDKQSFSVAPGAWRPGPSLVGGAGEPLVTRKG